MRTSRAGTLLLLGCLEAGMCPLYQVGVVSALPGHVHNWQYNRAFKIAAVQTWNALPEDVTTSPTLPIFGKDLNRPSYPDLVT